MSFHKSEDRKKIKDKLKKGFKEVKKSIGDIADKAADKLVPKEIAPFLPLAGMLVPGGMGITSYLLPQLLTALSTGKTRGDISLTGQGLTALGSFLKDPGPMFEGKPAPFGTKVVTDPSSQITFDPEYFTGSMEVPKTFADLQNPSLLDAMKEDVRLARQFFQGTGPVMEKAVVDGKIQQLPVLDAAGEPITKASLGMFDKANFPRLASQAAIFGASPLKDFYDTASDELDAAIREQEEAERRRKQARARLGDFFFSLSDPTGRFRNFDLSGLMGLAAGGRVGMDDGGFLDENYNKLLDDMRDRRFAGPRMRKLATGVLSSSGIMGLLDFLNIFGTGGGLLAEGGRVGFSEGGRDEVGQRLAERGIKSEAMMNRLKTQAIDQFRKKNKIPTNEVLEIAGNNAFQSFLGNFVNKGMNKMMEQAKDFSKKVDLPETRKEYFERVGMGPFTQKSMVDMFAADGGRVSAQEGGPISGITDMINQSIDEMQDNLSQQIQGGFTTQETIVPIDAAPTNATTQPQGFQAMPNIDLFRQRINQMRSRLQQPGMQEGPQGGGQALGQAQQRFMPLGGPFGGPSTLAYQRQRQGRPGISSLFNFAEGGMTSAPGVPSGMQVDGRDGTFIPMGVKEKADDVPAMLSKNEFVMTADAVRAAGGGSVNKGAQRMYDLMNTLEAMA